VRAESALKTVLVPFYHACMANLATPRKKAAAIMGAKIANYSPLYAFLIECQPCRRVVEVPVQRLRREVDDRRVGEVLALVRCRDCGARPFAVRLINHTEKLNVAVIGPGSM
jgi:hypothetical protein